MKKLKKGIVFGPAGTILILLFLSSLCLAASQPEKERPKAKTIKDIRVLPMKDEVQIDIRGDGSLRDYKIMQLLNPSRLVLDFPKITNASQKWTLRVNDPALKGIRLGKHPDKVRIVFDFMEAPVSKYQIVDKGDILQVIFRHPSGQPSAPIPKRPVLEGPSGKLAPSRKEPGEAAGVAAPVKPTIPKPPPAPEPRPVPKAKPESMLPKPPAEAARKEPEKMASRPEFPQPRPFVMKMPEPAPAPVKKTEISPPPSQAMQTAPQRISLDFRDADLHVVFRQIAEKANKNIVVSDGVQGRITLRLTDVPWDQALDLILQARQLAKVEEGNTLRIVTREEFEKRK
jgi:type IV pilus assembly protein PilQ